MPTEFCVLQQLASEGLCTLEADLQLHVQAGAKELGAWLLGHIHELDHNRISLGFQRASGEQFSEAATSVERLMLAAWLSKCLIDARLSVF